MKSGFKEFNVLIVDEDFDRYLGIRLIIFSIVKFYVIFLVNKRMVIKRIGFLWEEKLVEVYESFMKVFDFI